MNLMAALWLNFFTCMHGDCIIRYMMISDSSVTHNRRNRQKYDFRRCIEDGYPPYIIAQYLLNTAKTTTRIRISSVNDIYD